MKKGGFLRNVLDTIRSNQNDRPGGQAGGPGGYGPNSGCKSAEFFGGQLKPQHFSLGQVARHGFPDQPTALAFDPVQKIAAIGTRTGALRIFGRPGVDIWCQHKPEYAITHIKFVINQGALITVTSDESIHLWSLRGPNLKLQLSSSGNQQAQSPLSSSTVSSSTGTTTTTSGISTSQQIASSTHNQSNSNQVQQLIDGNIDIDFPLNSSSSTSPKNLAATGAGFNFDNSKSRQPEILHTLKFQREHITCLTLTSKWLYIGTERGNVHVANVETFELSGYSIAWNKAIELSRKNHPGSIINISECPQDTNKLLIGYESGCIVLWDLKQRNADGRYYHTENLLWLAWHYEGKQFVAAHGDGSLITWQIRSNTRPAQILYPHAKTPSSSSEQHQQSSEPTINNNQSFASSFARAMNNELYRPINKVDWKTSKNNEQFLLFSGGLPYDGLSQQQQMPTTTTTTFEQQQQRAQSASIQRSSQQLSATSSTLKASSVSPSNQLQHQQQFIPTPSPISPSLSPSTQSSAHGLDSGLGKSLSSRQSSSATLTTAPTTNNSSTLANNQQQQKEKKSLRSTSLTIMYGKSITVLEMDDRIIDFITILDNYSPYENDTSDPFAVIVLLSNDLILIDLTSYGYPSFDSPYPASSLNESPVTCVKYLADCSSDLIPFLYSTSQNVISRAPKKGFSDKEWPINGGEWGQSMQSYPELVITGHQDGTIKFWDMSSVNFDLISKIKTSKLFERPCKLPNSIVITNNSNNNVKQKRPLDGASLSNDLLTTTCDGVSQSIDNRFDEMNYFAIERIEYNSTTKHLLVASSLSQVIQFKLNKPKQQQDQSSHEITTIIVPPITTISAEQQTSTLTGSALATRQHLMLKVRNTSGTSSATTNSGSSAVGSSTSGVTASQTHNNRSQRSSGFQAEIICLTPLLVNPIVDDLQTQATSLDNNNTNTNTIAYTCQAPPKVTALAFQATHNILAYAHQNGIVLLDIIQKCIIMNATLSDLYGGTVASNMTNNHDINIQPFATSSILQHHYQSTGALSQQQPQATGGVIENSFKSVGGSGTGNNGALTGGSSSAKPLMRGGIVAGSHDSSGDLYTSNDGTQIDNAQPPSTHKSGAASSNGPGNIQPSAFFDGDNKKQSIPMDNDDYDQNRKVANLASNSMSPDSQRKLATTTTNSKYTSDNELKQHNSDGDKAKNAAAAAADNNDYLPGNFNKLDDDERETKSRKQFPLVGDCSGSLDLNACVPDLKAKNIEDETEKENEKEMEKEQERDSTDVSLKANKHKRAQSCPSARQSVVASLLSFRHNAPKSERPPLLTTRSIAISNYRRATLVEPTEDGSNNIENENELDERPIAPPRNRKRQSIPMNSMTTRDDYCYDASKEAKGLLSEDRKLVAAEAIETPISATKFGITRNATIMIEESHCKSRRETPPPPRRKSFWKLEITARNKTAEITAQAAPTASSKVEPSEREALEKKLSSAEQLKTNNNLDNNNTEHNHQKATSTTDRLWREQQEKEAATTSSAFNNNNNNTTTTNDVVCNVHDNEFGEQEQAASGKKKVSIPPVVVDPISQPTADNHNLEESIKLKSPIAPTSTGSFHNNPPTTNTISSLITKFMGKFFSYISFYSYFLFSIVTV